MRSILYLTFFFLVASCNSNEQISLEGNWYSDSNIIPLYDYIEVYVDSFEITPYSEVTGLRPSISYSLQNDTLYYLFDHKKKEIYGKIKKLNDSTLSVNNDSILLRKINHGIKLEDMLINGESEKAYFNHFMERKRKLLSKIDNL